MDVKLFAIEALRKHCCDALCAAAAKVRNDKQELDSLLHLEFDGLDLRVRVNMNCR